VTGFFPGSEPGQAEGKDPSIGTGPLEGRVWHSRRGERPLERAPFSLTSREVEVLQCLADGMSTEEIAGALSVSYRTVQGYVQGIITKLQVRSKLEAVLSGLRLGIVDLR
jgi:DNA-binding NarL/FixJ family response regulator